MIKDTLELPKWLEPLLERPVAVFGLGVSGAAVCDLLGGLNVEVEVFAENGGEAVSREFCTEDANRFGLVVFSPGFPVNHPWLKIARAAGIRLVGEADFGASFWKGPIVAVTGTNGKTTLTEFLVEAFESAGIAAFACGNIGRPFSRLLADRVNNEAIAVCEVSSFQSQVAERFEADYVLWTNFDEDHLDRHSSMKEYFESKYNLVRLMRGNVFRYGSSVLESSKEFGVSLPSDGLVSDEASVADLGIIGTTFESKPELYTYLMARSLWLEMGLSENELIEAAHNFLKSPHRMELVKSVEGVSFWDDSKATNFHAVYGALSRFSNPVIWIGGGKDKGGDLGRFSKRLSEYISSAHLIGETAKLLYGSLQEQGVEAHVYADLGAAVEGANAIASSGDNILLSPGFASLDMFDSYSQRGEVFRKTINSLETL